MLAQCERICQNYLTGGELVDVTKGADTMANASNIFSGWHAARKAARAAQGPVMGWIESTHERGRYFPIVCGTRGGMITGPCRDGARA